MLVTKERYLEILEANLSLNPDSWFEDEPSEEGMGEEDFVYSGDLAIALVEQGETFWECPGWVADIARELLQTRLNYDLPRLKAIAHRLLTTLPSEPSDEDLVANLRYLADGEFCVVFEGACCSLLKGRRHANQKLQGK